MDLGLVATIAVGDVSKASLFADAMDEMISNVPVQDAEPSSSKGLPNENTQQIIGQEVAKSIQEHDERYHPDGYHGGPCSFRNVAANAAKAAGLTNVNGIKGLNSFAYSDQGFDEKNSPAFAKMNEAKKVLEGIEQEKDPEKFQSALDALNQSRLDFVNERLGGEEAEALGKMCELARKPTMKNKIVGWVTGVANKIKQAKENGSQPVINKAQQEGANAVGSNAGMGVSPVDEIVDGGDKPQENGDPVKENSVPDYVTKAIESGKSIIKDGDRFWVKSDKTGEVSSVETLNSAQKAQYDLEKKRQEQSDVCNYVLNHDFALPENAGRSIIERDGKLFALTDEGGMRHCVQVDKNDLTEAQKMELEDAEKARKQSDVDADETIIGDERRLSNSINSLKEKLQKEIDAGDPNASKTKRRLQQAEDDYARKFGAGADDRTKKVLGLDKDGSREHKPGLSQKAENYRSENPDQWDAEVATLAKLGNGRIKYKGHAGDGPLLIKDGESFYAVGEDGNRHGDAMSAGEANAYVKDHYDGTIKSDGSFETPEEHAKHCKADPKSNCPFLNQHKNEMGGAVRKEIFGEDPADGKTMSQDDLASKINGISNMQQNEDESDEDFEKRFKSACDDLMKEMGVMYENGGFGSGKEGEANYKHAAETLDKVISSHDKKKRGSTGERKSKEELQEEEDRLRGELHDLRNNGASSDEIAKKKKELESAKKAVDEYQYVPTEGELYEAMKDAQIRLAELQAKKKEHPDDPDIDDMISEASDDLAKAKEAYDEYEDQTPPSTDDKSTSNDEIEGKKLESGATEYEVGGEKYVDTSSLPMLQMMKEAFKAGRDGKKVIDQWEKKTGRWDQIVSENSKVNKQLDALKKAMGSVSVEQMADDYTLSTLNKLMKKRNLTDAQKRALDGFMHDYQQAKDSGRSLSKTIQDINDFIQNNGLEDDQVSSSSRSGSVKHGQMPNYAKYHYAEKVSGVRSAIESLPDSPKKDEMLETIDTINDMLLAADTQTKFASARKKFLALNEEVHEMQNQIAKDAEQAKIREQEEMEKEETMNEYRSQYEDEPTEDSFTQPDTPAKLAWKKEYDEVQAMQDRGEISKPDADQRRLDIDNKYAGIDSFVPPSKVKSADVNEHFDDMIQKIDSWLNPPKTKEQISEAYKNRVTDLVEDILEGKPVEDDDGNAVIGPDGKQMREGGYPYESVDVVSNDQYTDVKIKIDPTVNAKRFADIKDKLSTQLSKHVSFSPITEDNGYLSFRVSNDKQVFNNVSECLKDPEAQKAIRDAKIPLVLGRGADGKWIVKDLASGADPHGLVCGASGGGKTVWATSAILALLLKGPKAVRLSVLDGKGVDFSMLGKKKIKGINYAGPDKIATMVDSLIEEMDKRNAIFRAASKACGHEIHNLEDYNKAFPDKPMAYMPVIFDEMQVAMAGNDPLKASVERLMRLGRNAGIHVLGLSQTADATGSIPTGISSQMGFRGSFRQQNGIAASKVFDNNRTMGEAARALRGKGEGVFMNNEKMPVTFQASQVANDEFANVLSALENRDSNGGSPSNTPDSGPNQNSPRPSGTGSGNQKPRPTRPRTNVGTAAEMPSESRPVDVQQAPTDVEPTSLNSEETGQVNTASTEEHGEKPTQESDSKKPSGRTASQIKDVKNLPEKLSAYKPFVDDIVKTIEGAGNSVEEAFIDNDDNSLHIKTSSGDEKTIPAESVSNAVRLNNYPVGTTVEGSHDGEVVGYIKTEDGWRKATAPYEKVGMPEVANRSIGHKEPKRPNPNFGDKRKIDLMMRMWKNNKSDRNREMLRQLGVFDPDNYTASTRENNVSEPSGKHEASGSPDEDAVKNPQLETLNNHSIGTTVKVGGRAYVKQPNNHWLDIKTNTSLLPEVLAHRMGQSATDEIPIGDNPDNLKVDSATYEKWIDSLMDPETPNEERIKYQRMIDTYDVEG